MISPLFFNSKPCMREVRSFVKREKNLGTDDLILPIHLVTSPGLERSVRGKKDWLKKLFCERVRLDWQEYVYFPLESPQVSREVRKLGQAIIRALDRLGGRTQPLSEPPERGHPGGTVIESFGGTGADF